jgi:hypothetical protein
VTYVSADSLDSVDVEIDPPTSPATQRSAPGVAAVAPAGAGLKFDTGKVLTNLLPMGALSSVLTAIVVNPMVTESPWTELFDHLVSWRRGSKTFGGVDRMGIVAASLLVLLTRELRGDVRVQGLFPGCGPAMLEVARVLTFGASKYGANNWQTLANFTDRYYAAILRHLFAHGGGETKDPESGLPHLAHAACGALFLLSDEVGHDPA